MLVTHPDVGGHPAGQKPHSGDILQSAASINMSTCAYDGCGGDDCDASWHGQGQRHAQLAVLFLTDFGPSHDAESVVAGHAADQEAHILQQKHAS